MLDEIVLFLNDHLPDAVLNGIELVVYTDLLVQVFLTMTTMLATHIWKECLQWKNDIRVEEELVEEDEYSSAEEEQSESDDEEQQEHHPEAHRGEFNRDVPAPRRAVPAAHLADHPSKKPTPRPGRLATRTFRHFRRNHNRRN